MPHDHELHPNLPERPEPGQGDRADQAVAGRAARLSVAARPADLLASRRHRVTFWRDSFLRDHAFFRVFWRNCAEVIPGKLYRANHPTPAGLTRLARAFGLKTIVNLRGEKENGSTTLTVAAAGSLGLDHVFMAFESRGAPHRARILLFHEIYQAARRPMLVHCKSGADRAGLAAGLAILFEGGSAADAIRQLSWRFGHVRQSRTGILDAFFELYQRTAEGRRPFLEWVRDEYNEDDLRARFKSGKLANFLNDSVMARE